MSSKVTESDSNRINWNSQNKLLNNKDNKLVKAYKSFPL